VSGWAQTRLRYVTDLNPPIRGDLLAALDTELSFLPMDSIGENGSLNLERTRPIAEVRNGYSYFEDGDVAFAKVTPCFENGKGALMQGLEKGAGFGTTEITVLRPKTGTNARYLRYIVQSEMFRQLGVGAMTGAGGLKRVPDDFTRDFKTVWPGTLDQERIANFLDDKTARIDALIAEKERLLLALEEWQAAELTRLCFGQETATEGTGNRWIPALPIGWRLVRLKHLVSGIEQGWSPECEARLAGEDEWAVLKAGAANGGVFRESEHKTLPGHLEPILDLEVKPGDVLATRASGTADYVGSVAFVYSTRPKLMLSDKNFRFKFNKTPPLLPELLAWMCNTRPLREQILQFVGGAEGLAKNIGSGNFREIWLAVPPMKEQPRIIILLKERREQLEKLKHHLDEHIARLREYRSSLISAAVTGELQPSSLTGCA
jgi:type I restriction enzyme S subunit